MEYKRFGDTIYARLDRGEEILSCMEKLAGAEGIRLADIRGLGAIDEFTVSVYDVDERKFYPHTFTGPHEVTSLAGSINTMGGKFYAHLHMSAADTECRVVGGHLNRARISGTGELVLSVTDGTVDRFRDEAVTGLNLFCFEDGKTL